MLTLFARLNSRIPLAKFIWLSCGLSALLASGCKPEAAKPKDKQLAPLALSSSRLRAELPPPRDQSFVGSEACRECHEKISAQYDQHPMGLSIAKVSTMNLIEKEAPNWLDIPGPDKYRVDLTQHSADQATQLVHQQLHQDPNGNPLETISETIDYAIGSGQKGRAYFIFKDQMLFQSPLGWYTAKSCWDLSPGYKPQSHPGFQRRIDNSCLYCHAGRVDDINNDQYKPQVFHEAVIGCERCHGPGEKHIAYHRARKLTDPNELSGKEKAAGDTASDPICNPANLAPAHREDVCNQCHLQAEQVIPRFGRSFFDFRPGDRIEDVFVAFLSSTRQESRDNFRAVSHVEQMRESRCYQAAPQTLGCTSCHDPHQVPEPAQRVAHYRQSCLKCHTEKGCSLPVDERLKTSQEDSCIVCHMPRSDISNVPHTAQTDHRILRDKDNPPSSVAAKAWTLADGAQDRLPAWEVARARGLAMMTTALQKRDPAMAAKARQYLIPQDQDPEDSAAMIAALANDPESLSAIASSYWLEGLYANARPFWDKALQSQPFHETALSGLIQLDLDSNDLPSAERNARKLTEFAPAEATHWAQLSSIQWKLKRYADAIASAEKALQLDPDLDDTRRLLTEALQEVPKKTPVDPR